MVFVNKLFSVRVIAKSAILTVFLGLSLMVTQFSYAQDTPCDPNYMRALEARAWLEMNREITQNQNLIAKPDSVLEYTCFDRFLQEAATGWSDRMFSETTRWGTISGFNTTSTNTAISQVVGLALVNYLTANFNHEYLGGRADTLPAYSADGSVPEGAYTCGEMAMVWSVAKCTDFFEYSRGSNPNRDGFMDFYWYRNNDPRDLPTACTAPLGMYNRAISAAFNNPATNRSSARYILPAGDENDFSTSSQYDVDNVVSHLDFIMYQGHALAGSCQTVHTGIMVDRVGITTPYQDGICPNPGCHYDRSSEDCQP